MDHISKTLAELSLTAQRPSDTPANLQEGKWCGPEARAWDVYFASLMAMAEHPGNRRAETALHTIVARAAQLSDLMVYTRRTRICRGS